MNVAIVLAGLTPRAKQIDGMGFGGKPAWDFADRVGLLKGLKGPALDWAYYRYCGHEAKLLPVVRYLQMSIDLFCGLRRYRLKRETRAGLVDVALQEYMAPICHECDGAGKIHTGRYTMLYGVDGSIQPVLEDCPRCRGAGKKTMSTRDVARFIGVHHSVIKDSHCAVISEVNRLLSVMDGCIVGKCADE